MKKVLKYTLLTIGWIFLGIIVLLILISLLIQTRPVKNKLAGIAENQAQNFIHGNLTIGKIDGNFFTGLVLEDILLEYENDTVVYIAEVSAEYNIFALFEGKIEVPNVHVEEPYVFAEQYNDSTWNFQKIVKPAPEKTDTTKSSGTMQLSFPDFRLNNGLIVTSTPDTIIPQKIEGLEIALSFQLADDELAANLKNLSLQTIKPNFVLNQLSFEFLQASNSMELNNFHLKTALNKITGQAEYSPEPPAEATANLKTEQLQLQEFEYFVPNLKIPAKPVLQFDGGMMSDSVWANLVLEDGNQQITLDIKSANLASYLLDSTEVKLDYNLDGSFRNIDIGHWSGNPDLNHEINGNISAKGRGIDPSNAELLVKADLGESIVQDKRFNELVIDLELFRGNLRGMVKGNGEFGAFRLEPNVKNLLDYPVYNARLVTENLNLAQLLNNDSLSSNINLVAEIDGEAFEPEKISANAKIRVSNSRFQQFTIDTLFTNAGYKQNNLVIDTLGLLSKDIRVSASGNYNLNGPSDLWLRARFNGVEALQSFLPDTTVHTNGNLQAHLTGTMDSLNLDAELKLYSTVFQELKLQELNLTANASIAGKDTSFSAQVNAFKFSTQGFQLDSISATAEGSTDSLYATADVSNSYMATQIKTGFVPGNTMKFAIDDWNITYKNQEWALQNPATIRLDSTTYEINNLNLASGSADSAQVIQANGKITLNGPEDFSFEAKNIDISKLAKTLEQEFDARGILNLNLALNGTANAPILDGGFNVEGTQVNEYKFTNFNGSIHLEDNQLRFETLIVPEDSGRLDITATLPVLVDLDTMGFAIDQDAPIDGSVVIDSFSLAILKTLNITGDIAGYIQGNVELGGTINEPDPTGDIRLVNASVEIGRYGIDYRDIILNLSFVKNSIRLDSLGIRSDDGSLSGTGAIDFSSVFYKGDISKSKINFDFNQFNLVDHNQFNMQVSGNANLSGEKGNVVYGGDLKIPQAEIYLPAIMSMMGKMSTPEMPKPILVRHAEQLEVSLDSIGIESFEMPKPDSVQFDYFDSLEGQMRIRIPKNTWVKNQDMRIEISGELELIKNKEFFELFGSVEVVRGQYDLLGKTFVIDEGIITFQGGEEMLPRLNIEATYAFRNAERVEQELTVQIKGTAEQPEVEFLLDGSSISEGDALSYILFGKSMDALTMNEQQNVDDAGGSSLAGRAAASIISSQITDFLGDRLNVDYIEVKSEGSFDNASVVVGKYITNDLFVSYEQRFGEVDEKDLAKYEVTLEYELFRFLFLELNNSSNDSGFDVIVKFDVK